jgi:hypothetical protein
MSTEHKTDLVQYLIDYNMKPLEEYAGIHKSIKDASKIIVEPMGKDGTPTGESFVFRFYTDAECDVQKAMLAYYDILIEGLQQRIKRVLSSADAKNVFREHRGGLAESLETTIECPNGLSDIKAHYKDSILRHFIKDMYIQENAIPDDRLPYVWGGKSYNVIARSIEDDSEFVIGQCNFYE